MTFYHGTRRGFTRGGWLMPRSFHHGAPTMAPLMPGFSVPPHAERLVYFTTSLDLAWVYAYAAVGRGRPKVLVVQPYGEIERDPEHSPAMEAYCAEMARVIDVLTEPTITEEEARSGWVRA